LEYFHRLSLNEFKGLQSTLETEKATIFTTELKYVIFVLFLNILLICCFFFSQKLIVLTCYHFFRFIEEETNSHKNVVVKFVPDSEQLKSVVFNEIKNVISEIESLPRLLLHV